MQTASEKLIDGWIQAKASGSVAKMEIMGDAIVEAYRRQVKASLRLEDCIHRMTKAMEG